VYFSWSERRVCADSEADTHIVDSSLAGLGALEMLTGAVDDP